MELRQPQLLLASIAAALVLGASAARRRVVGRI